MALGLTHVNATISGPTGASARLRFLVDSGAMYTLLPESAWQRLDLKPQRRIRARLADGSPIERNMSEAKIRLRGHELHTPVILGQGADQALLGVITLEEFGLMLNPFDRTLQPMEMFLV